MAAVGTARLSGGESVGLGNRNGAGGRVGGWRLPSGLLGGGKLWGDFEEGAHAVEFGAPARM